MVSPEELAHICLSDGIVKKKDDKALFFNNAAVVIFDGLIIWRGDLNMHFAADRLKLLAKSVGLPVAVIQEEELKDLKRKKTNPGKFLGPAFWKTHSAWDTEIGLDSSFWGQYDGSYLKKEPPKPETTETEELTEEEIDALATTGLYGGWPD
jgi:hypothetical protein